MTNRPKMKISTIMMLFDETAALRNDRQNGSGMAKGETDNWFTLVQLFRSKIENDQDILINHERTGRAILYKQLADAYKIGLELINDEHFKVLQWLAYHHNMNEATKMLDTIIENNRDRIWNENNPNAEPRELKPEVSPWVYVVKLLYGKWFDTTGMTDAEKQKFKEKIDHKGNLRQFAPEQDPPEVEKTAFQVWRPNRSAEKYAVIFRYLHNHGITAEEAADFIENFVHTDKEQTKRLGGIERAGREEARQSAAVKAPSQAVLEKQAAYVARAEARNNWNVFEVEKPSTFPSKFTYARAVLKQDGDALVIMLVEDEPMAENSYIYQAVKLGKPLLDEENEQAAQRQSQIDAVRPSARQAINRLAHSDKLSALVADGDDADEINAEIQALLDKRAAILARSKALDGFADPIAS